MKQLHSRRSSGVPHEKRPDVRGPVHVVLELRRGLPSLRTPRACRALERASRAGKEKGGFGLFQFSVQREHLHLVVEVHDRLSLTRGLQGLAIRVAKGLNRHWHGRHGSVFAERYFARALEKSVEVWRALRYVLNNARKHGTWLSTSQPDPFSSGRWFSGWCGGEFRRPLRSPPLARPHLWETLCWWNLGPIGIDELPGRRSFPDQTLEDLLAM